jgi:hypothetical protein
VWKIGLGFLTFGTSLDVFFHKFSESRSFVRLLHEFSCVRNSRMAPCWTIVDFLQHGLSFLDVVVEKKFLDCQFGGQKKGVVKEDTRFISIHLLVKVLSSGKEISDSIRVTRDVGQFIIKILKVLDPAGLLTGNLLRLAEVLEVLVICTDLNRVCSSKEERSTTFESEQDGCKFLVVGIVVLFGG